VLPPSTSTLVLLVHLVVSHFVLANDPQTVTMHRLVFRRLLEDAGLMRIGAKRLSASWIRQVAACIRVATRGRRLENHTRSARPARLVRPPSRVRPDA
jgi:hypothetical protein